MRRRSMALRYALWGFAAAPVCALGLTLLARSAAGDSPADDGAPRGTVAFFMMVENNLCPPGWVTAASATGRLVVGVTNGDLNGLKVGNPLADQEDRAHVHGYSSSVKWPFKSISAADGNNQQGAAAMDYPVAGQTDAHATGLPFMQLLACEKQ